jgi:deoxyribose-phosphate aldolase
MTTPSQTPLTAPDLARMIDHTLLKPEATPIQIDRLCAEARQYGFASVCVNPVNVHRCADKLRGSPVKVCSVIGFPLGANASEVKAFEAGKAIQDGASEVDMVINIGALKAGETGPVRQDIHQVVEVARAAGALVKVIVEACLLTDEEKATACRLAKEAGADFVKTSTGFSTGGATVEDVALMRRIVGGEMGVKAAGGVRTLADARRMIEAGATRIGSSAGVKIIMELQG